MVALLMAPIATPTGPALGSSTPVPHDPRLVIIIRRRLPMPTPWADSRTVSVGTPDSVG